MHLFLPFFVQFAFPVYCDVPSLQALCEGQFVVQPQVEFDVGLSTVAGLISLGYYLLPVRCLQARVIRVSCAGLYSSCLL